MTETKKEGPAFQSEAEFARKLRCYLKHCEAEPVRLPNVAGFCRFCNITRASFYQLKEAFPLGFDVAQSTFLDEALNHKVLNTAATMTFFCEQLSESGQTPQVKIVCAHDPYVDGQ